MRRARLRRSSGLAVLLAVIGGDLMAEERRLEGEISYRYESLDSGFDDWQTQRLDLQSSRPGETTWYGAALRERRFGIWDEGLELGAAVPLDGNWVLQPEVGRTFDADFLPEWYADLRLQRRLSQGFVGSASVRRTQYDASRVDRLALGAERYWGNWRAAYTLNVSEVQGAGNPVGHAVALDHYYHERSVIGVRASAGQEEEGVPGGEVVTSDVTSFTVRGRHWLDTNWALSWELGTLSQGDLYDRHGIQLGVRRAF
ncbi:YaiO family outer membrane beta-barrel protein [Halomonas sp. ML-15]|uniref:YaiO family outer membrane beta-barrel protein n=1 Tax=Halomonas sp. ML-15 TaxID=2773305 RepID=UPI0017463308|nr:YaiO family outer membrane beta-barrel protein [Halomonas sp. ML-15]MBD3895129.1 YaiO family outer membrane beta-barrel protein [Halomonas sp. ML-15]